MRKNRISEKITVHLSLKSDSAHHHFINTIVVIMSFDTDLLHSTTPHIYQT